MNNEAPRAFRQMTRRQALALGLYTVAGWGCSPPLAHTAVTARKPNFVVFLADSLRPDHLGCYGYPAPTSPVLDRFSETCHQFDRCYASGTWTRPSVNSLFTGLLPTVHQAVLGIQEEDSRKSARVQRLRGVFPVLHQQLGMAGYHTAWFLANPVVESQYGLGRGWNQYHYVAMEPASEQALLVSHWLRKEAREPFFLFVHCMDPHDPYVAPEDAFLRLHGQTSEAYLAELKGPDGDLLRAYLKMNGSLLNTPDSNLTSFRNLSQEGLRFLIGLYDAGIAHADRQFGRILAMLEARGLMDRTLIAVLSDHGEAFGEHGYFYHGHSPFEHQVRVPLLMRIPKQSQKIRVPWTVSLCDVHASLLEMAGVNHGGLSHGKTLFRTSGELAVTGHRAVFADFNGKQQNPAYWDAAMIMGPLKAVQLRQESELKVFDVAADPGETQDILKTGRGASAEIQLLVEQFLDERGRHLDQSRAFGPPEWVEAEAQNREALEALGYL